MAEPISIQQLKDASEDAISLAEFIYKPANVMIPRRLAADINSLQYYLDYMSSYAQHSYETYDEMVANAVNLPENISVFVTNDLDSSKNGIYTYNGTSFIKGDYQPENAAKDYVEAKLGGLQVFNGKVRAQDISTVDGNTQDIKNLEFRNELDALPFEGGVLADTFVVVDSTLTQRQVNRGFESIEDMLSIVNPKTGLRAYVKSYHAGLNKGGGEYVYTGLEPLVNNGVNKLNGWVRSSPLDIFSGGIKAEGSDDTVAFQRTYDVFSSLKLAVDLQGLTINTASIDLTSDSIIHNGTLDVRSYVAPQGWDNNFRRAPIMSKYTPRNSPDDFEYDAIYRNLSTLRNVTFKDVVFKTSWFTTMFYCVEDIEFARCKFYTSQGACIQAIGGWSGTPLMNDTPTEYNIIQNTKNPRNKNIRVIDCYAEYVGEITATKFEYASLVRTIGCEDVLVQNCKTKDMRIAIHADIYNTDVRIMGGYFEMSERSRIHTSVVNMTDGDFLGIYIGQNSFNYLIQGVKMQNLQRPIYLEGASQVDIKDVIFDNKHTFLSPCFGVLVQANHRDNIGNFWANCADVTLSGTATQIRGYTSSVVVQPAPTNNITCYRNINIRGITSKTAGTAPSIVVQQADDITVTDNAMNSLLQLNYVGKHTIARNTIKSSGNYTIYISNTLQNLVLNDNILKVDSGALIYIADTTTHTLSLLGGSIELSNIFVQGLQVVNARGITMPDIPEREIYSQVIDLAAGSSGVYKIADSKIRPTFQLSAIMQSEAIYAAAPYNWKVNYVVVAGVGEVELIFYNNSNVALNFTANFYVDILTRL